MPPASRCKRLTHDDAGPGHGSPLRVTQGVCELVELSDGEKLPLEQVVEGVLQAQHTTLTLLYGTQIVAYNGVSGCAVHGCFARASLHGTLSPSAAHSRADGRLYNLDDSCEIAHGVLMPVSPYNTYAKTDSA
jgi:hypothetical protein